MMQATMTNGSGIHTPAPKNNESVMTLGQLIQVRREKQRITITEAAKAIKVNYQTYRNAELDKGIYKSTMTKILDYYRITEHDIQETKNGHKIDLTKPPARKISVVSMLRDLEELIDQVKELNIGGGIADGLKQKALENVLIAKQRLIEVQILDRLL